MYHVIILFQGILKFIEDTIHYNLGYHKTYGRPNFCNDFHPVSRISFIVTYQSVSCIDIYSSLIRSTYTTTIIPSLLSRISISACDFPCASIQATDPWRFPCMPLRFPRSSSSITTSVGDVVASADPGTWLCRMYLIDVESSKLDSLTASTMVDLISPYVGRYELP